VRTICIAAGIFCLVVCAATAYAEEGDERRWHDEAELSYVDTSGNSEVTTLSVKNKLTYQFSEKWSGRWKFQALNGESDGQRDAESYATELRGDYAPTERFYNYLSANWLKDRFADIDHRYTFGGGSGYKFLTGPKHFLLGEAGLSYTVEKLIDDSDTEYLGGRLYTEYEYKISADTKFAQSLEALLDFEEMQNYMLNSETALVTAINSIFSFKTSYVIKYDNEPAENSDDTDTVLAASLVANF
jgi:putative salt-induced outer membrane protein